MGVLRERTARAGGTRRAAVPVSEDRAGDPASPDRLPGSRDAALLGGAAAARALVGRRPVSVGLGADRRAAGGDGARAGGVRVRRAAGCRADLAAQPAE